MHRLFLVKKFSSFFIAVCILFVPFFECICCEPEIDASHSCCGSKLPLNQADQDHPCLDSLDTFSTTESLQTNSPDFTDYEAFLQLPSATPLTFSAKRVQKTEANSPLRRHLLLSKLVI